MANRPPRPNPVVPSPAPVRDALDFMLPEEVQQALRLKKLAYVYTKPIRKQYDGRRVLYRRQDVIAYLAAQQAPPPRNRRKPR